MTPPQPAPARCERHAMEDHEHRARIGWNEMIEGLLDGLVRFVARFGSSAMTLYYLAGFFIVVGGFVMFLFTMIQMLWNRSLERSVAASDHRPAATVHVDNLNLNIQMTESQLRSLLAYMDRPALPEAGPDPGDDDRSVRRFSWNGNDVARSVRLSPFERKQLKLLGSARAGMRTDASHEKIPSPTLCLVLVSE